MQQHDFTEPFTMDDVESVGGRHYWIEVDHPTPNTDTTWSIELCSEHYGEHHMDVYVGTALHEDITYIDGHRNCSTDWHWNPNAPDA